MPTKVGSLGQILADETVGVFGGTALPGAVGVTKPDHYAGVCGELGTAGHLGVSVIGEAFAHWLGDVLGITVTVYLTPKHISHLA